MRVVRGETQIAIRDGVAAASVAPDFFERSLWKLFQSGSWGLEVKALELCRLRLGPDGAGGSRGEGRPILMSTRGHDSLAGQRLESSTKSVMILHAQSPVLAAGPVRHG